MIAVLNARLSSKKRATTIEVLKKASSTAESAFGAFERRFSNHCSSSRFISVRLAVIMFWMPLSDMKRPMPWLVIVRIAWIWPATVIEAASAKRL